MADTTIGSRKRSNFSQQCIRLTATPESRRGPTAPQRPAVIDPTTTRRERRSNAEIFFGLHPVVGNDLKGKARRGTSPSIPLTHAGKFWPRARTLPHYFLTRQNVPYGTAFFELFWQTARSLSRIPSINSAFSSAFVSYWTSVHCRFPLQAGDCPRHSAIGGWLPSMKLRSTRVGVLWESWWDLQLMRVLRRR